MSSTPPLPEWVTDAKVDGHASAHRLCPGETRLDGTESLYGDWVGRVLLLAKDFAPSSYLRDRLERRVTRPYSHDPKLRTNIRLRRFASPFEEFGLLYGSAAGNLLREDGSWSGALRNEAEAREHGVRILRDFVLPNMREDTLIMCLGEDAWRFACGATNQMGDWRTHRDLQIPLGNMIGAYHPARASNANQAGPWQLLARMLSEPWRRAQ